MQASRRVAPLLAGLLLAGCTTGNEAEDSAWSSIVAQDYASARAQYESVLSTDPGNAYANLNIGVAYEQLGDRAMAAKHYEAAIAYGKDVPIGEVAQDGSTARRQTTVAKVAQENLNRIRG